MTRYRNILEYRKPDPWFRCRCCGRQVIFAHCYIAGIEDRRCICNTCAPAERLRSVEERGRVLMSGSTAPAALARERRDVARMLGRAKRAAPHSLSRQRDNLLRA